MGQLFGVSLQCFQCVGAISPRMRPAERRTDILIVLIQRLVPTERVRYQRAGEALQKPLDVALAPGLSVLVQNHRPPVGQLRCTVHKHIGLI